jgi:transcription initiation factor TFIID subunit 1
LEDDREDFEAMIDREMREEKYGKKGGASGSAGAGGRGRLLRGEDDDFDEDYDEDEGTADERTRVKDEPMDDAPFGSPSPAPAQHQPMEVEKLAPPPAKKIDVKDLFPSFEHGKTLEFTELFAMRPRKKRRVATDGVKRALTARSLNPSF